MNAAETLLKVADLKVHFGLKRHGLFGAEKLAIRAIDGVDLSLAAGETLGIVGESGCGKSTLGRAILRLIAITSGSVSWRGRDLGPLDEKAMRALRREMQIIFQDPLASLDPRLTVETIIGKPLQIFHPELTRAERRERVFGVMRQVGLAPEMAIRYPHEFSGGQCQRIGIARAIILKPKLIVCDEPVSALDVSIQAQIVNLLMRLQRDLDIGLLFISHNLAVVRHISHRVMVLYLGRVMETAPRDEFYRRPLHPYTQALIAAVPIADPAIERHRRAQLLEGDIPSPIAPPSGCRFRTRCPKASEICAQIEPPLEDRGDGHLVACHHVG